MSQTSVKYRLVAVLAVLLLLAGAACNKNKDNDTSYVYVNSQKSALLMNFRLKANTKVMAHLDSVYFTIDPERLLVYNADSLPLGTNVTHLLVNAEFSSSVGTVEFIVKGGKVQQDATITYRSTSTDSIDFTGDVKMRVTSGDGTNEKVYTIKVNVHQVEPDTLVWPLSQRRNLPLTGSNNYGQRTALLNGIYYMLVEGSDGFHLSTASKLVGPWTTVSTAAWGFDPQVMSFASAGDMLYVLDSAGTLRCSVDGQTWTDTGLTWRTVIGAYGNRLLGIAAGSEPLFDQYPRPEGFTPSVLPAGFPLSGSSQTVQTTNDWTVSQQVVMVGGVTADGTLTTHVWGYDGNSWAPISNNTGTLPALDSPILVPYYSYDINSLTFKVERKSTWLLFGGRKSDGTENTTVYSSRDQGITWVKAASGLQLPVYIPALYRAQCFVATATAGSGSGAPRRVSTAVTTWTYPELYIVGGVDTRGQLYNNIWRGWINRMTMPPVY